MADHAMAGNEGPGHDERRGDRCLPSPTGGGVFTECSSWVCFPLALSSIALDPLYPSRCSWETFGYATSTSMAQASDGLSPLQLSGQLNSLPCSLTFRQEETISIIRLIEQVGAQAGGGGRDGEPAEWGMVTRDPSGPPRADCPPREAFPGSFICPHPFLAGASGASGSGLRFVGCRPGHNLSLLVPRLGTPPTAFASASSSCCSAS